MQSNQRPLLTPEDARTAIAIATPSIEAMLRADAYGFGKLCKSLHLHVVIMRPDPKMDASGGDAFVLAERSFNLDDEPFERDYRAIGIGKGKVSLRTGLPTGEMLARCPGLFQRGDVKYRGSWVTESGIVVAASGIQSHLDEAVAKMVGAIVEGLLLEKLYRYQANPDSDTIPE